MNPALLGELRGWHLPEPPPWWPPAPGWWIMAGLGVGALLLGVWLWPRRGIRQVQRAARQELARLDQAFAASGDRRRYVAALAQLVRRLALACYPRTTVAGLIGEDWLGFLDQTGGGGAFSRGVGRALVDAAYRPVAEDLDLQALHDLIAQWIEWQGRRKAPGGWSRRPRPSLIAPWLKWHDRRGRI